MKYLPFLVLFLYSITASAQDCNREALKTIPGVWLPQNQDAIIGTPTELSAADVSGAKKILNPIQQLFQNNYTPIGADARHHQSYSYDYGGENHYGNRYAYVVTNFRFYCLNGKKTTSAEGDGTQVSVNGYGRSILNSAYRIIPIYDDYGKVNSELNFNGGFFALKPDECPGGKLPDVSDGYHVYGDENNYVLWFTHDKKLPYRYVTRKEFLEKQVAINEAIIKESQEKFLSPEMQQYLQMLTEAQKEEFLKGMKQGFLIYEKPLEAYKNDLKKDAAWLNEIAIVKLGGSPELTRYTFTDLSDVGMFVPIMPNPDYYDRKLPKSAPQFITIYITGNTNDITVRNQRKLMDDNIEFFKDIIVNRGLKK